MGGSSDLVSIPVPERSEFPVDNLPLGIGSPRGGRARAWVAIGDHAVDLAAAERAGRFAEADIPSGAFTSEDLGRFLAGGPTAWTELRWRLRELVAEAVPADWVHRRDELTMMVPVRPRDVVDFYSSIHHATNLGRIFRPDGEALLPNWRHLPVGYHGRSGTLVATDATIRRPNGLRLVDGEPRFGPSLALDLELEVGTIVGVGNEIGRPIPIGDAAGHLYGLCLVNDWSARDIQAFEYQPLGPFLGKSFATSVGPWVVAFDALAPYRLPPPEQDPPVADYLRTDESWGFDLHLEAWLQSERMRRDGLAPVRIGAVGFADMYWTPAQQLAHLTVNGASTAPGDLFASGTVSGPDPGTQGSLIEITANGRDPFPLPDGTVRSFLEDGDRVEIRGWAGGDDRPRIGFGCLRGTIAGGC